MSVPFGNESRNQKNCMALYWYHPFKGTSVSQSWVSFPAVKNRDSVQWAEHLSMAAQDYHNALRQQPEDDLLISDLCRDL